MILTNRAYRELFGKENEAYNIILKYSGKFSDYNANVRLRSNQLTFHLSRQWEDVDEDIKLGLIQELMVRILCRRKKKPHTHNIDIYNNFIKSLHLAVPKTKSHPILEESFKKVNDQHFRGMLEQPNLVMGINATRTFGSYNYQNDTITISKILEEAPKELLDYVMYHEMLHKHLKFECKNGRGHHHTPDFKRREKQYPNQVQLEKDLNNYASRWKRRKHQPNILKGLRQWFH